MDIIWVISYYGLYIPPTKQHKTQQESPFAAALKVTAPLQVAASVAASLSVAAAALEVAAASVPQPKESQAKGRNRMEV